MVRLVSILFNRAVGVRGVEQDGAVTGGDDVLEVARLLGGVVLRVEDGRLIAKLLGPLLGGVGEHDKPRIVERGDDDGDFGLAARRGAVLLTTGSQRLACDKGDHSYDEGADGIAHD